MTIPARISVAAHPSPREHVNRVTYRAWVRQHIPSATVRSARMRAFDDFTDRWPRLRDWFQAPLRQRLFDRDVASDSQTGLTGATVIMPYLSYLSLVHGVALDYPLLLGRQFASPFTVGVHQHGLGVDSDLFDSNVSRLIQLGYSAKGARTHLLWPLGRMLLHRGDPDLTALTLADLEDLRRGVDEFTALLREDHVRELFARPRTGQPNPDPAGSYSAPRSRGSTPRTSCCSTSVRSTCRRRAASIERIGPTTYCPTGCPRRSGRSSSVTSGCTWTPTLTDRRPFAMRGMHCDA